MSTTTDDADVAASTESLVKVYGRGDTAVVALDGVSVRFQRGVYTAIMGPSGSGKSTLMHCMAALDSLNRMMLTTAYGQELDIQNPADEASYWRVVENKSAPFYGGAIHLGALLSEAQEDLAT